MHIRDRWYIRYLFAAVIVLFSLLARKLLVPVIGEGTLYITVYPAIIIVAVTQGAGPGLFSAVLGLALVELFLVEPMDPAAWSLSLAVRWIIVLLSSFYVARVTQSLRTARARADADTAAIRSSEQALRQLTMELDLRVKERTKEVEESYMRVEIEKQKLFDVLETLPAYVILLNRDYRTPFANRFFRERFGESHGRRCYEFLFNKDSPCENCETYKPFSMKAPHHWEWTGPDNRTYDIYDYLFKGPDSEDLILEMGIDITGQKQAQKELEKHRDNLAELVRERTSALQESEARLKAVYLSMTEGLANHDIVYEGGAAVDYVITDVNPAYERITGLSRDAAVGRKASELYGTGAPPYLELYAKVADSGIPQQFETNFPQMAKHFAISVFSPEKGKFATVFSDITVRKLAEEDARASRAAALDLMNDAVKARKQIEAAAMELRENQQLMNRAQEIAHLGSWELDLVRNQLIWSDEVYRIFGLNPQEFKATYASFLEIVHPDDRVAVDTVYANSLQDLKSTYEIEHRIIQKHTGTVRIVHEKCEHVKDESGRIVRSIGMVHDITERKQAEEEIQNYRNNLERLVDERTAALHESQARLLQAQKMEAVGRLAGGIAHDFNNMMQVVTGFTHRSLHGLDAGSPLHGNLMRIKEAAERAADLTSQLLVFSRRQVLQPVILDINRSVGRTEQWLRRTLGENIRIVTSLSPLPLRIRTDPVQFEQVLINLAINARDAMPSGGTLTIETGVMMLLEKQSFGDDSVPAGEYVMCAVTDTGCGMDEQTRARIFEPFFTTKPAGKGSGLGLATAYGTIRQSGGVIRVSSAPGDGTTFKVYLPRSFEPEHTDEQPALDDTVTGGSETILLIEDDERVRDFTALELEELGYHVLQAPTGEEGIARARAHDGRIDILLTDVVLPGLGGRQVSAILSEQRPDLKTLFISGYAESLGMRHGFLDAGTRFLAKPFTPVQLAHAVRKAITGSPAQSNPPARTILLVDDDTVTAESIAVVIADENRRVELAGTGLAALETVRRTHPDVVILDIGLPDMDGCELARKIRGLDLHPAPRIIALSGAAPEQNASSVFDECMVKPIDFTRMRKLLGTLRD